MSIYITKGPFIINDGHILRIQGSTRPDHTNVMTSLQMWKKIQSDPVNPSLQT